MSVFCDKTNLSANPNLWGAVRSALGSSEWLLFIASPNAAASKWVGYELAHWQEDDPRFERLLVVLTDGELAWKAGAIDWQHTTALPRLVSSETGSTVSLDKAFSVEPFWIDARWAKSDLDLSLQNPQFQDLVATLSAAIQRRPKEDLIGEDVRQHLRLRQTRNIVFALLSALLTVAVALYLYARSQRDEAFRQQDRAERFSQESKMHADEAVKNQRLAEQRAKEADVQRDLATKRELQAEQARDAERIAKQNAEDAARRATARQLATQSLDKTNDFETSALLAVSASSRSDDPLTRRALLTSILDATNVQVLWRAPGRRPFDRTYLVAYLPNGRMVVGHMDGAVSEWTADGRFEARQIIAPLGRPTWMIVGLAVSGDGSRLATVHHGGRVLVANTNESDLHPRPLAFGTHASLSFRGDRLAVVGKLGELELWNVDTRQRVPLLEPFRGARDAAFVSKDRLVVTTDKGAILLDSNTGTVEPLSDGDHPRIQPSLDGTRVAVFDEHSIALWRLESDKPERLTTLPLSERVEQAAVANKGDLIAVSALGALTILEAPSGLSRRLQVQTRGIRSLAFSPDSQQLAFSSDTRIGRVDVVGPHGDPVDLQNFDSFVVDRDARHVAVRVKDGFRVCPLPATGRCSQANANLTMFEFSPTADILAGVGSEGVTLWTVPELHPIRTIPFAGAESVQFSATGGTLAVETTNPKPGLAFVDIATGRGASRCQFPNWNVVDEAVISSNLDTVAASALGEVWFGTAHDCKIRGVVRSMDDNKKLGINNLVLAGVPQRLLALRGSELVDVQLQNRSVQDLPRLSYLPDHGNLRANASGQTLLLTSADRAWLIDANTGLSMTPAIPMRMATFNSSGRYLVLGLDGPRIEVIDLALHTLRARACGIARRTFTPEEQTAFFGGSAESVCRGAEKVAQH